METATSTPAITFAPEETPFKLERATNGALMLARSGRDTGNLSDDLAESIGDLLHHGAARGLNAAKLHRIISNVRYAARDAFGEGRPPRNDKGMRRRG